MSGEKISVVIPAHNAARFLAETVGSVRAQTIPPAEIIIVDDGSTDGTPHEAAALGGGIHYLRQNQRGAGAACNCGAEAANGEWLAFLDADDLWLPAKLAVQLDWMRAAPQTEVVFGHGCNFTIATDGTPRNETPRPAFLPSAVLLRREFFLQRARFDEQSIQSGAVAWYLHLQSSGANMAVVPQLVLLRRLHDANLRRQGDGGRREDLRLLRDWIKRRRPPAAGG